MRQSGVCLCIYVCLYVCVYPLIVKKSDVLEMQSSWCARHVLVELWLPFATEHCHRLILLFIPPLRFVFISMFVLLYSLCLSQYWRVTEEVPGISCSQMLEYWNI